MPGPDGAPSAAPDVAFRGTPNGAPNATPGAAPRVAIAGAGIGGLAAALALHARGVDVTVFEAVDAVRPLGVGINVLSPAVAVLGGLGLADAVAAAGVETREVRFVSRRGQTVWGDLRGRHAGHAHPQVSVHRGRLQMLLLDAARARLGPDRIRTGARLAHFADEGDAVRATFRTPNRAEFTVVADVLVGADGIHSAVRGAFHPDEGPPCWNGVMMARGVTEAPAFLDGATMIQAGYAGRKFVCYPITRPAAPGAPVLVNWIADLRAPGLDAPPRESWNRPARLDDYLPHFADWDFGWIDVPALMRGAGAVYEFPMVDRDPLPRWSAGRVTLLGDAAHPMYPIGSNGATQAVLDAAALAAALGDVSTGEAPSAAAALARYEGARREPVARLIALNRQEGLDRILDLVESRAPGGFGDLDAVLPSAELQGIVDEYKRAAGHAAAPSALLSEPSRSRVDQSGAVTE